MNRFSLDNFIITGEISGLKNGEKLFSLINKENLTPSNLTDENGNVDLYDYQYHNIRLILGTVTNDFLINHVMVKMQDYANLDVAFTLNQHAINLQSASLPDFLEYLNKQNIHWEFKTHLGKVIVINIAHKTELIYSFEIGEEGFFAVQTPIWLKKD